MASLFPELSEPQRLFEFPKSLTEKWLPQRISDFVGLTKVKPVLLNLSRNPRPVSLIFYGEPGTGKTSMAFAVANEIGSSVRYISVQKFTGEELDRTWEAVNYLPPKGKWWVVICDEADYATERAQLQWLSKADMAKNLRPVMGGSSEPGSPLPVIWIMTCNSLDRFEKRLLSRCMVLDFSTYGEAPAIADYLASIWDRETSGMWPQPEALNFARLAKNANGNIRDCLLKLDLALMAL